MEHIIHVIQSDVFEITGESSRCTRGGKYARLGGLYTTTRVNSPTYNLHSKSPNRTAFSALRPALPWLPMEAAEHIQFSVKSVQAALQKIQPFVIPLPAAIAKDVLAWSRTVRDLPDNKSDFLGEVTLDRPRRRPENTRVISNKLLTSRLVSMTTMS